MSGVVALGKYTAEAENLSVTFTSRGREPFCAVKGFSFGVAAGECVAVVGESGSGKSTLLRALLALVPPSGGAVRLFGEDISKLTPEALALTRLRCGYVPQDPYGALPPSMSVLSAAVEPFVIAKSRKVAEISHDEAQKRAISLLSELGISGEALLSSRGVGLSGGQRQRVELARALLLEPEILFADEPTSMQDVSTRGDIIDVLLRRVGRGMAMVFVTHDLSLAAKVASRVVVMQHGVMCEQGSCAEVMGNPQHDYTKQLLRAMPKLPVVR